jgi:hypothetical protein
LNFQNLRTSASGLLRYFKEWSISWENWQTTWFFDFLKPWLRVKTDPMIFWNLWSRVRTGSLISTIYQSRVYIYALTLTNNSKKWETLKTGRDSRPVGWPFTLMKNLWFWFQKIN